MVLQITYELKDSDRNYSELFLEIENLGSSVHFLRDSWWVEPKNATTIENVSSLLRQHLGENDLIQVVDITDKTTNGWLARTSWDWLKQRSKIQ
jgi:hypothetical protein